MQKNTSRFALYSVLVLVLLLIGFAKVRYTSGDVTGTLLVSQEIVQRGTIKLDHYSSDVLQQYGYVIHQYNHHYYYYFPLGTPLVSVPFVAIANAVGLDMAQSERSTQIAITAVTAIFTIVLLFKLAMLFLPYRESVLLATLFWLGSSFASTTGTALWSHNFATLFALLAIYLVIKSRHTGNFKTYPLVALYLFLAYLCRPTLALLAPFVILFLFAYEKKAAIKAALLLSALLTMFVAFSYHEFGQALPHYYLPQRLEGVHFSEALIGNLISPARGLLVFSPFLLLPLFFGKTFHIWNKDKILLLVVALVWPITHLVFVSRFPHWWAGWSYGSRFMTDALPGLFVLLCHTLSSIPARKPAWVFLLATGFFAIFVNSYQGLYNEFTAQWNAQPNIDQYPEYLFTWRYPQFLHNQKQHEERLIEFQKRIKEECSRHSSI